MNTIRVSLPQIDRLASVLAGCLQTGDVVCLNGAVGAGKSTLARAVIRYLLGDIFIPSPTFSLVQTYPSPIGDIWHMDWYRLQRADDIFELGVEEAFYTGISLIEWAEKARHYLPPDSMQITITGMGNSRNMHIQTYKNHHAHMQDITLTQDK